MSSPDVWWWLAVVCAGAAATMLIPPRPRLRDLPESSPAPGPAAEEPAAPRWWMSVVAPVFSGLTAWQFLDGPVGVIAGVVVAVVAHRAVRNAEPADVRREREQAERDLPALVDLLAATLRSGTGPAVGLAVVCDAFPGAVSRRLDGVRGRLELGTPPAEAWRSLIDDPVLAPLGRALARAESTGASVVATIERLADELDSQALSSVEDRARGVGVRAAIPLGLCLLPGFLLLGIVPSVAGLLSNLI